MITTMSAVREVLATSGLIPSDIDPSLLNASALARRAQPLVTAKVKRPVQVPTITVCISRLIATGQVSTIAIPKLTLDAFHLQSGLTEISYSKTPTTLAAVGQLHHLETIDPHSFFAVTFGSNEISIFAKSDMEKRIYHAFGDQKPKMRAGDLGYLSVQFNQKYLQVPNVIFALLRSLAAGNINVIEIISTFTELVFVVAEEDLQVALHHLHTHFA